MNRSGCKGAQGGKTLGVLKLAGPSNDWKIVLKGNLLSFKKLPVDVVRALSSISNSDFLFTSVIPPCIVLSLLPPVKCALRA